MVPIPTDKVKNICPAAASHTLGLVNESYCGVHKKFNPSNAFASGCSAVAPDVPSVRPLKARNTPNKINSGIPIFAAFSTPANPRDKINVFSSKQKI
ncbi:MAG: hypothetical protein BWY67_02520 [Bacteroidetes bacterium ADurb.Bin397]|nr:MAG: hypothetical protein BWY67_02520 [Bacteroidetes bacterium ADurb.Bin397]